jgi:RNA polymerase sigma factor (TIGR02999 family)
MHMGTEEEVDLKRLISAAADGDRTAGEQLLPLVYDQLRRLARARLQALAPGQTLQATALVHEAYVRIISSEGEGWSNRNHFFAAAANAMRNILVEQARRKSTLKHGGEHHRQDIEPDQIPIKVPHEHILQVNDALERLEAMDVRKAKILKLRYFGGLSFKECGAALGISLSSIEREWRFIKAWLLKEIGDLSLNAP